MYFKHNWRMVVFKFSLLGVFVLVYPILYKIYIPRVSAFGCFDDCFNFMGGYFILKGKTLYSQIFFNHQPLMAYISFFIQKITHPTHIFELVLRHRQFVFLFGFLMNLLIVGRFGLAGLGFAFFYEFSKFYLFGDRFLAEGLIVYPLVYMSGLALYKLTNRKIVSVEYILLALFTWFVIFIRLPFMPLALLLYFLNLSGRSRSKFKFISISVLIVLVVVTFFNLPFKDYIFNIVTVNRKTVFAHETRATGLFGIGMLKVSFYPLYLFLGGEWNIFRYFLAGISASFIFLLLYRFIRQRKIKETIILLTILSLANLRVVSPGAIYYSAFHLLVWYGILLIFTWVLLVRYRLAIYLLLILFFAFFGRSAAYFAYERIDQHEEFITNYGYKMQVGNVIKALSDSNNTLFLDGFDDIIYWQANLLSPYKYSWYTSVMPRIPKYAKARIDMFTNSPPDFYYGSCPDKEVAQWTMPQKYLKDYQQLYSLGELTCVYIHKTKLPEITAEQWGQAKELLYELPGEGVNQQNGI